MTTDEARKKRAEEYLIGLAFLPDAAALLAAPVAGFAAEEFERGQREMHLACARVCDELVKLVSDYSGSERADGCRNGLDNAAKKIRALLPPADSVSVPREPDAEWLKRVAVLSRCWPEYDTKSVPIEILQIIQRYHKAMIAASDGGRGG